MMADKKHEHSNDREVESRRFDKKTGKTYVTVTYYCRCGQRMGTGGHWE